MWQVVGSAAFEYSTCSTTWQEMLWCYADQGRAPWRLNVVLLSLFFSPFVYTLLYLAGRQHHMLWGVWQIFSIAVAAALFNCLDWVIRYEGRPPYINLLSVLYCPDLRPRFLLHLICLRRRYKTELEFHEFSHIWWVSGWRYVMAVCCKFENWVCQYVFWSPSWEVYKTQRVIICSFRGK